MLDDKIDDLINELMPWYLQQELENVCLLEKALANEDFSLLINIGDKMHGHGTTFGFERISFLGKRIELAAIEKNKPLTTQLISVLKTYILENLEKFDLKKSDD